jgi:hypothetical protein
LGRTRNNAPGTLKTQAHRFGCMVWVIDDVVSMVDHFVTAASTDPLAVMGIVFGALFVGAASAAFGGLALAGLVDPLIPDSATQQQRRQH